MREHHHDFRPIAAIVAASLAMCLDSAAYAQTADYFATPWIEAPTGIQPGAASTSTTPAAPGTAPQTPGNSSLYNQSLASSGSDAPPVIYTFGLGVDEIATDNVAATGVNRTSDLGSLLSASTTVTADTVRLHGVLAATGLYRREINDSGLDQFMGYAYGRGQGTIIPGSFYATANTTIDDIATQGGGIQNALAQPGENTHVYVIGGSPYYVAHAGDVGTNVVRYQIGQAWFGNDASGQVLQPGSPAPLAASTNQSAREDFKMAGTILPRLMSDVSLSGSEDDAANSPSGDFETANGELINEYEVLRSFSLIGGAGYEAIKDSKVPSANDQEPTWDLGARIRPNADSYALILYGRHDLKSDFAGEIAWRLTPFTDLYASYADSLGTRQQAVIANNADSVLGPEGVVNGITFDQNPVIGVLDDSILDSGPGNDTSLSPLGIPVGTSNDYTALQNGLFRSKILSGSGRTRLGGDAVVLTAYDVQQISLTPVVIPSTSTLGGNLSWLPSLSERLSGLAVVGCAHETGTVSGVIYNGAAGVTYLITSSLELHLRYDYVRHDVQEGAGSYVQNSVTLGLHKYFD